VPPSTDSAAAALEALESLDAADDEAAAMLEAAMAARARVRAAKHALLLDRHGGCSSISPALQRVLGHDG
jgi:hypothetical protein